MRRIVETPDAARDLADSIAQPPAIAAGLGSNSGSNLQQAAPARAVRGEASRIEAVRAWGERTGLVAVFGWSARIQRLVEDLAQEMAGEGASVIGVVVVLLDRIGF